MQRPLVDYFPSYEAATLSAPDTVWEEDRLHVASGFVGKIVAYLLDQYLDGGDEAARGLQRARTFLLNDRFDEAEAAARAVLELRPDEVEAAVVLAEALIRLMRSPEAEVELRRWIGLHPERADLRVALARAIFRGDHRRGAEALAEVEAAVDLPTMGLTEFRAIGELIRRRAAPDAAERLSRMPVDRFPLHVEGYGLLVNVLLDQHRTDEAIEVLRQASKLRRVPAALRLQLAELLIGAGQEAEAETVVRAVLKLEPDQAAAKALLARLEGVRAGA
jgi:predicted Zn-dependent protease